MKTNKFIINEKYQQINNLKSIKKYVQQNKESYLSEELWERELNYLTTEIEKLQKEIKELI